jgi:uncharacterized membrane protein YeaQ/YmgE (transglycosylase-associated protein family)
MINLLVWIVVGGLAGWIASMIMGDRLGLVTSIIVGMIGSLIGGAIVVLLQTGTLDFTTAFNDFNLPSILVSTLGAVVLLWLLKVLRKTS